MANPIRKRLSILAILLLLVGSASLVYSHCQIPCGIYDDPARFDTIAENITTIEKSMKQIVELSANQKPDMNQIVRWVNNKEEHADDISHIITYYFMAQRIKPVEETDADAYRKYVKKLTLLHKMLVYCMKCKQTTDLANVEMLKTLLSEFRTAYLEDGHTH
ncbi:MAG TPA: superoxide dismutase [Ni] [Sedimentisphaerales bacterium]|nr:superoxide dismutase [Ni] [Sedimentisphaerales bacterium]